MITYTCDFCKEPIKDSVTSTEFIFKDVLNSHGASYTYHSCSSCLQTFWTYVKNPTNFKKSEIK